ncbi:STAS domain-containing protein [Nonomuraea sp. NPDC050786]|uniref:STAS domain-containing protein n=1 Tax=Nonomuraea sp. NPDC050786 TaxID=3154840 RepID=UPI0033DA8FC5
MTSTLRPAPSSAVAEARSTVRFWVDPVLDRRDARDGTWWPYSRDAAAELPGLVAAADQRLGRATLRVGLHADAWDDIPRLIPARGRQIRVDCLREGDPQLIVLTLEGGQTVRLLVVPHGDGPDPAAGGPPGPPRPAERPAERPTDRATERAPESAAESAAGPPEAGDLAGWENEGGHLADQDTEGAPRLEPPASLGRSEHRMTVVDAFPLGRADPSVPTTVRLYGELDMFTSPALRSRLLDILKSSTSLLILDLSEVSFCDASGLAVMVGIQQRARPMGITVALSSPRPFMSKLLRITGLDRSLPMAG